ncbi:hypothetical protein MMC22_006949 [Lobaria immixta]|nr:hypothetical protein [Lobaria immixta]
MSSILAPIEKEPSIQTTLESKTSMQAPLESQLSTQTTLESESSVQAPVKSQSSIQTALKIKPSTERPLKCQEWMNDLWKNLNATSKAHDSYTNTTQAKILGKHSSRMQWNLRVKLAEKKSSLDTLVGKRAGLHRRTRVYKERAIKVRKNALATIPEDLTTNPEIPKLPRLSEKNKLTTWVKESLHVYGKYLASHLVDASIKPRIKKIRRCLWWYLKTGKGIGMVIAKGNVPSRSDLQNLNIEIAVMLAITSKITRYTQILDESLIEASFRPRVVEIVGILKSYQEKDFRVGLNTTALKQFEKEIQDHLKTRV